MSLLSNCLAFWPLSEASGALAASSVNSPAMDATIVGTVGYRSGCPASGYGLAFIANPANYVALPQTRCFRALRGFTAACWVKRNASGNGTAQRIMAGRTYTQGSPEWAIEFDASTNKLLMRVFNHTTGEQTALGNSPITDTNPHHVAMTWDGPQAGTPTWRLYIDGVLQTATIANEFYDMYTPAWPLLAKQGGANDMALYGSVGPAGVWNRALSAAEINALAIAASPVPTASTFCLVNFFPPVTSTAAELSALWAASPLASLIGARTWQAVATVSSTISAALAAITDASSGKRYALLIPNGTYAEKIAGKQYVDLMGQSRSGVIVNYTPTDSDNTSTFTSAGNVMLANMTVKRGGAAATGRYPIHDDVNVGNSINIYLNVDAQCLYPNNAWPGFGIGAWSGQSHWFIGCSSNTGWFGHNAVSQSAAVNINILSCNFVPSSGLDLPIWENGGYPNTGGHCGGILYFNIGSGKADELRIRNTTVDCSGTCIAVANSGAGAGETLLKTEGNTLTGVVPVSLVDAAKWSDGQGAVTPIISPTLRASQLGLTSSILLYGNTIDDVTGNVTLPNTDGRTFNAGLVLDTARCGPSNGTAGTYHAPETGEVAKGVHFGPSSSLEGEAILTAASVRTAIGLALGNLDAQLSALPTAAQNANAVRTNLSTELERIDAAVTSRLAAANYAPPPTDYQQRNAAVTLPATPPAGYGGGGMDADGIREAVGLESANLGSLLGQLATEVATIPTTEAPTANQIWELAGIVDGKTPQEALRIMAAVLAGKVSGAGSGVERFLGLDGETPRVEVTCNAAGNRTAVNYA